MSSPKPSIQKNDVIVRVMGGLGNQLFQLAFGLAKAKQMNGQLWLDASHYRDCTDHTGFELDKIFPANRILYEDQRPHFKVRGWRAKLINYAGGLGAIRPLTCRERFTGFDEYAFRSRARYFTGYWQSQRYWQSISSQVYAEISRLLDEQAVVEQSDIKMISETNAVAVHIRLGDYYANAEAMAVHGVDLERYYLNAIESICGREQRHYKFFVFSDDPEPLAHFKSITLDNVQVYGGRTSSPYTDLYLMSRAPALVIANSTFSWWAGFLSAGRVYSPSLWLNNCSDLPPDIYPKLWHIVSAV